VGTEGTAQSPLTLNEQPVANILAINRQQVEGVEAGPVSPEQQRLEVAPASPIEAHDLAIDDCVVRFDRVCKFLTELRPMLERVAVARAQLAMVARNVRQRPESVVLDLEEPIGVVEWFREADERHRAKWPGSHSPTVLPEQYRCQAQPLLDWSGWRPNGKTVHHQAEERLDA